MGEATMNLEQALSIVKAAGYRVTKPNAKRRKVTRVGPTCVCKFSDGEVCRMSTWSGNAEYDWERGMNNCRAAYCVRKGTHRVPDIVSAHFERDGVPVAWREQEAA